MADRPEREWQGEFGAIAARAAEKDREDAVDDRRGVGRGVTRTQAARAGLAVLAVGLLMLGLAGCQGSAPAPAAKSAPPQAAAAAPGGASSASPPALKPIAAANPVI